MTSHVYGLLLSRKKKGTVIDNTKQLGWITRASGQSQKVAQCVSTCVTFLKGHCGDRNQISGSGG